MDPQPFPFGAVLGKPGAERHYGASPWQGVLPRGLALSLALHAAALAAATIALPALGRDGAPAEPTPVEIVPAPAPKADEAKPDAEPPAAKPPKPEPKQPDPPKPLEKAERQPPAGLKTPPPPVPPPAAAAPPIPEPPRAAAPPPPPPAVEPPRERAARPALPPALPPDDYGLAPPPRPPRAAPAKAPTPPAGEKLAVDDDVPMPGRRGRYGHWVLQPIAVDTGHRCGVARINGVIDLEERVAEGRHRGKLRTRITWSKCPPEGVLYRIEMRVSGDEVMLIGAEGFTDHGVMGRGVMLLRDSYGQSVWYKR